MKNTKEGHRYDDIKTAKELIHEVALNGISLNQEDRCRAQDIIGHSTVGELSELANSFAQVGNKSESSIFYFIIQNLWAIEDVIRFWNINSNPEHQEVKKLREETQKLKEEKDRFSEAYESLLADYGNLKKELKQMKDESSRDTQEILSLKARLFDFMEQRGMV